MEARAALAACPVAAIRVETKAERRHRASDKQAVEDSWTDQDEALVQQMSINPKFNGIDKPFPLKFHGLDNVYYVGHHNDRSFGAVPYLFHVQRGGKPVWIMVDTPRFGKSAMEAVTGLTGPNGPDYLFLTHVDDTADHSKWASEFSNLKRIFHSGDLGRHNWVGDTTLEDVEILLQPQEDSKKEELTAYTLDGAPVKSWNAEDPDDEVVILHTPGHSPGSISLYKRPAAASPGILFTGDTYAFTPRDGGHMTGFPHYGNDLRQQSQTLEKLLELDWDLIAPGHGHSRDYRSESDKKTAQKKEMQRAMEEMMSYSSW